MALRVAGWIAGGAVTTLLLGASGWGMLHAARTSPGNLVGKPAPTMTISSLDGSHLNLSSLTGTPVVVNFWASWCVPCRQEAPVLNAASREYGGRVQFVGVDIQDSESAARSYQAQVQSPYPVGPAISGDYRDWGVSAPPETLFVNRKGVIISKIVGPVDRGQLQVYMSQLGP
jgi:cytochrome c biogenesis protein CcmG, thiol:disulfide interchange protein DsbE